MTNYQIRLWVYIKGVHRGTFMVDQIDKDSESLAFKRYNDYYAELLQSVTTLTKGGLVTLLWTTEKCICIFDNLRHQEIKYDVELYENW